MNQAPRIEAAAGLRRLLVVDDSKAQRLMLRSRLSRWGFSVIEAADGDEALRILESERVSLVLSDWVMPGLNGPELCQKIRESEQDHSSYFILLTSKSDKEDVSAGLTAGADDFLSKPVDESELRARLRAGLRQIELQDSLRRKNDEVSKAYTEVKSLYEQIDKDLRVAASLQQEVLPPPVSMLAGVRLEILYRPAGHVGGDLVGYFPADDARIGVYGIDVSGHGVASSLLTIRLAQFFSPNDRTSNVAFARGASGEPVLRGPADVVRDLNRRFLSGDGHDLYFTIVYGVFDTASGRFTFCQAGHPHPLLLRASGRAEFTGGGGAPVGLLSEIDFREEEITLGAGDSVLLYSDGIVEAETETGEMIGEAGFAELAASARRDGTERLLARLERAAEQLSGRARFEDDVSMLLLSVGDGPES